MKRIIDYEIKKEYEGMKISGFLKKMSYPEKCLTKLRHTEGAILLDNQLVHMNHIVSEGSRLTIIIEETESSEYIEPMEMPLNVVYEDEDIIVIDKAPFMPVHPSMGHRENTLANGLMWRYKDEGFVFRCITRLDRDTTGLVLVAKHYLSGGILARDIQDGLFEKQYLALVAGVPINDEGHIDLPIARESDSVIKRCVDFNRGDKAVTDYIVEKRYTDTALLRVSPKTGRTHQIRVHLSHEGYPLVGDFLYNPEDKRLNHQALHACYIKFTHPISRKIVEFCRDEIPDKANEHGIMWW